MLRSAAGRSKALPVNQEKFDRILSAIWWKGGNHPRLGLAISGGVDSMALASLCSKTTVLGKNKPSFTAFIVDHRLRRGSDIEAENVARVLEQINVDTRILKLDWTGITNRPERLVNLESMARRLRFQALGNACKDYDINSLLLAHHGDDQAETVMSRLVTGYTGTGFRGIQSESNIPECHGLYGVSESGSPYRLLPSRLGASPSPLQIEEGGVHVYRPLLDFSKSELIATCEHNAVKWFEDPTNADKSLTLRNTVRHLWAHTQMPKALSPDAMINMAQRVEERAQKREQAAEAVFNNCSIELNLQSGSLDLSFPTDLDLKDQLSEPDETINEASDLGKEATYVLALLLRRILTLVSPKQQISLQELEALAGLISRPSPTVVEEQTQAVLAVSGLTVTRTFPSTTPSDAGSVAIKGPASVKVHCERSSSQTSLRSTTDLPVAIYTVQRERVKAAHMGALVQTLIDGPAQRASSTDLVWTNWALFDGRFWIRLRYRPFNVSPSHSFIIRFLEMNDLEELRRGLTARDVHILDSRLRHVAPGKARYTLPVIIEKYSTIGKDSNLEICEDVCALPTIDWGTPGWRPWKGREESTEGDFGAAPWMWECRYKMIDFGAGKGHSVKSMRPNRSMRATKHTRGTSKF